MAYFRTCSLKKRGQVFTRVGLLVDLYSVIALNALHYMPRDFSMFPTGVIVSRQTINQTLDKPIVNTCTIQIITTVIILIQYCDKNFNVYFMLLSSLSTAVLFTFVQQCDLLPVNLVYTR